MATNPKIDLFKAHKTEYAMPKSPLLISTTEAQYLSIRGTGEPGGNAFTEKVGILYAVAYTLKMTRKAKGLQDYVICKLEARWWVDKGDLSEVPASQWQWQLLIRTPDLVDQAELDTAKEVLLQKGKSKRLQSVCFESLHEGDCVQMLHLGPYDREAETVAIMSAFAEENGFLLHGRHH